MAALLGTAVTAEVALTAATSRTALQLVAAANHAVRVLGFSATFDGVSPTGEPVLVELVRQTTAGTMSSLTPVKKDPGRDETLQTTAQHTATAEPTTTDVLDRKEVHPQSGYEKLFPLGQEIIVPGGGRVGLRFTAPDAVNVVAQLDFEE